MWVERRTLNTVQNAVCVLQCLHLRRTRQNPSININIGVEGLILFFVAVVWLGRFAVPCF